MPFEIARIEESINYHPVRPDEWGRQVERFLEENTLGEIAARWKWDEEKVRRHLYPTPEESAIRYGAGILRCIAKNPRFSLLTIARVCRVKVEMVLWLMDLLKDYRFFRDVPVGGKVKLGTLVWEKMTPCVSGPWKPQNLYYRHPKVGTSHQSRCEDDEIVRVIFERSINESS